MGIFGRTSRRPAFAAMEKPGLRKSGRVRVPRNPETVSMSCSGNEKALITDIAFGLSNEQHSFLPDGDKGAFQMISDKFMPA